MLRPLNIEQAWAGATPHAKYPVAPRYSALLRAFSPPLIEPTLPGASVLFASVREMLRFGMFHLQTRVPERPVLSAAGIKGLQEPSVPNGSARQSLAWSINENRHGYRTLLAQGGTVDSQAWLLLVPTEKIVVAVLANYGSAPAVEAVDQILSTLLPTYRESLERKQTPPPTAPSSAAPPTASAEIVGKWSGQIQTYRGRLPLALAVLSNGDVDAALGHQKSVRMTSVRSSSNGLSGRMRGDLGVADTGTAPYELRLQLRLKENRLTGAAVTYPLEGYEGPRLPFWVELKHQVR